MKYVLKRCGKDLKNDPREEIHQRRLIVQIKNAAPKIGLQQGGMNELPVMLIGISRERYTDLVVQYSRSKKHTQQQ
jgi:hypothetical protein